MALFLQGCPLSDAYYIDDEPADSTADTGGQNPVGGTSPTGGSDPRDTSGSGFGSTTDGSSGPSGWGGSSSFSFGTDGSTDSECDFEYDGLCWRLGNLGDSCAATCNDLGGPAPNLAEYVGTEAQGGSLETCQQLIELLNVSGTVSSGTRQGGGVGCHLWSFSRDPWWLREPAFDPDARSSSARILCGCVGPS